MNSVTGLSLGRIGIGIASLVKPDLVQSTMGTTTTNPLLTQWFGSREIAPLWAPPPCSPAVARAAAWC